MDFEQADNAVNEMLERSTADSGFYRPLRDVSRPSESPERVLAQVQADEVLARRLQVG